MIVIVSAIISYDPSKGVLPSFKRFLVTILPYLLVTFLYLALRSQIVQSQPSFGGDGAYFRVGANVIVNLPMLLFAAVTEIQAAQKHSARLGRILNETMNEIYVFDAETLKFMEVSAGALINLGYSMEEMTEMTPMDLKPLSLKSEVRCIP